jgi:hypothetical protein
MKITCRIIYTLCSLHDLGDGLTNYLLRPQFLVLKQLHISISTPSVPTAVALLNSSPCSLRRIWFLRSSNRPFR